MAEKVEFASAAWLAAVEQKFRAFAAANPDARFSICEVFTDAPKHLAADGVIAWHCRAADGKLEFALGEADDVDMKNIADYQAILPFARMRVDAETRPTYEKMAAEVAASGKLKRVGDPAKIPPGVHGLHNDLADITA
ncbi:MAG: hypothetical protein R3C16_09390 [Hyphomonadaceae bacterium]